MTYERVFDPESLTHQQFVSYIERHQAVAEHWEFVGAGPFGNLPVHRMRVISEDVSHRDFPGEEMLYRLKLSGFVNEENRAAGDTTQVLVVAATNDDNHLAIGFGEAEDLQEVDDRIVESMLKELTAHEMAGNLRPLPY